MEGASVTAGLALAFLLGLLAGLAIDTSSPLVSWTLPSSAHSLGNKASEVSYVTAAAAAAANTSIQPLPTMASLADNAANSYGHVPMTSYEETPVLEEISMDGAGYKDDRTLVKADGDASGTETGISLGHIKSLLLSDHFQSKQSQMSIRTIIHQPLRPPADSGAEQGVASRTITHSLNGSHWSPQVEQLLATRFERFNAASLATTDLAANWTESVRRRRVVEMREGCGRMQNRLLIFEDGSRACARYRVNVDQIQGDVFACHFARHLLGIANALPCVLSLPDPSLPGGQWLLVGDQLAQAQWHPRKVVVLTPWIDGLHPTPIPVEFRLPLPTQGRNDSSSNEEDLQPVLGTGNVERVTQLLRLKTDEELIELAQWSDLIVFDYTTANLDRLVNNLHNLQWNPAMLSSAAHNLERWTEGGLLVFVDNESGFFHGYRLLDRYAAYHSHLLNTTCLYRRATVQRLHSLCDGGNAGDVLMRTFTEQEPLHKLLPAMPASTKMVFQQRLQDVCSHLSACSRAWL